MAIITFMTLKCEQDARAQGHLDKLRAFAEKIEDVQSLDYFDPFPQPFLVKKKFGSYQGRLIASRHNVAEHMVVCFRRLLIRSDLDYSTFEQNADGGSIPTSILPPLEEAVIAEYVAERFKKEPPREKPALSEPEVRFLTGLTQSHQYEKFCCESREWVARMADGAYLQRHSEIYDALEKRMLLDWTDGTEEITAGDLTIIVRWIPSLNKCFLAAPILNRDRHSIVALREKYKDILAAGDIGDGFEASVLQHSRRSYPYEIFWDKTLWLEVQRDTDSNIALSPEESRVLSSVASSGFPLFINGRAGSGKSTVLQYIFAEYLHFYFKELRGTLVRPPAYLTYNTELLRKAKDVVYRLLTTNYKYLHARGGGAGIEEISKEEFGTAFHEFQSFLHSLIPVADAPRFLQSKRVTYPIFHRLWTERFGRDRDAGAYGPDLSWHVLRGYIKGNHADEYMTPDEFKEYPAKQKSVSQEAFTLIHQKVWEGWYQDLCENQGYWDDQDLARRVLEQGYIKPEFPLVVCDEAQDFTRLELEVIYRSSIFSERKVDGYLLPRVPYAFAGDEFQTINPTGFKWEAIKAYYVEKFVSSLDPLERRGAMVDLNYQVLTYNYRSAAPIVHLSNEVQAIRAVLFNLTSVCPQKPWAADQQGGSPMLLGSDSVDVWEALRNTDVKIIIPCEMGEEEEFVSKDRFLKGLLRNGETVPRDVLSVARAKGLEFPRVAVYKFGEALMKLGGIDGMMKEAADPATRPEQQIPQEFLLNKLYVAISRAQRRLFILDGRDAQEQFWWKIQSEDFQVQLRQRLGNKRGWQDASKPNIVTGDAGQIAGDAEKARPETRAKEWETLGKQKQDALFMQHAAGFYKDAGHQLKAQECLAWEKRFEGKHLQAGKRFAEIESWDEALDDFWAAGEECYQEIVNLQSPKIAQSNEYKAARCLSSGSPDLREVQKLLINIAEQSKRSSYFLANSSWILATRKLCDLFYVHRLEDRDQATQAYATLTELSELGFGSAVKPRAVLALATERFRIALELLEKADMRLTPEYKRAQAETVGFPQNIELLHELNLDLRIVSMLGRGFDLTAAQRAVAFDACIKTSNFDLAIKMCEAIPDQDSLRKLIARIDSPKLFAGLARSAVVLIAGTEDWGNLVALLKDGKYPGLHGDGSSRLRDYMKESRDALLVPLISAIAGSKDYRALWQNEDAQKYLTQMLRRSLADRKDWKNRLQPLSLIEIGTAIEKIGRWTACLEFYETVKADLEVEGEHRRLATLRWAKCKQRQAELMRKDSEERGELLREARSAAALYNTSLEQLPEYPGASEIASESAVAQEAPKSNEYRLDGLLLKKYRDRVVVSEESNGRVATIHFGEKQEVQSLDVTFKKSDDGLWTCKEWRLTVEYRQPGEIYVVHKEKPSASGSGQRILYDP